MFEVLSLVSIVVGVVLAILLVSHCESNSDVHSRIRDKEIDHERTAYLLDKLRKAKSEGWLEETFRQEDFNSLSHQAKIEAERESLFPAEWIATRTLIRNLASREDLIHLGCPQYRST